MRCECVLTFAFSFCFSVVIFVLLSMEQVIAAEAGPLDSAICRDAAIYREASLLQLEKFTTEAKALTAECMCRWEGATPTRSAGRRSMRSCRSSEATQRPFVSASISRRTFAHGATTGSQYARRLLLQHQCHCSSSPTRLRPLRCRMRSCSLRGRRQDARNRWI